MSEPVRPGSAAALSEAEIQLLGTLATAADQSEPTDRANLVCLGGRDYEDYLEDWSDAFDSLVGKGLLADRDGRYALTAEGARHASTCRAERPGRNGNLRDRAEHQQQNQPGRILRSLPIAVLSRDWGNEFSSW